MQLRFNHVLEGVGWLPVWERREWVSRQDPFSQGWALRLSPAGSGGSGISYPAVVVENTVYAELQVDLSGRLMEGCCSSLLGEGLACIYRECFSWKGKEPAARDEPGLQENKRWHLLLPTRLR